MQHTEKYQLNLIEKDDVFSPDPLNENMEKLDNALLTCHMAGMTEAGTRAAETAALDARVTALEVQKIYFGTFLGNGDEQTIDLGFTPLAVLLVSRSPIDPLLAIGDEFAFHAYEQSWLLKIVENGFRVQATGNFNEKNRPFNYIAFV